MTHRSDAVSRSRISISVSISVTIPLPGDRGSDLSGGDVPAAGSAPDGMTRDITVTYRIDGYAGGFGDSVAGFVVAAPVKVTREVAGAGTVLWEAEG